MSANSCGGTVFPMLANGLLLKLKCVLHLLSLLFGGCVSYCCCNDKCCCYNNKPCCCCCCDNKCCCCCC